MFGVRDFVWAMVVVGCLTLMFHCRPTWSAHRSIERDAATGFAEAYTGARYLNGDLIAPEGQGAHADPLRPPVQTRQLEIKAERFAFTGNKADIVARHVIYVVDPVDGNESQEVHFKLERRGGQWVYTLFETRDGILLDAPSQGNPWARALRERAARAAGQASAGNVEHDDG